MFKANRENKFKLTVANDLIRKMEDTDTSDYSLYEYTRHTEQLADLYNGKRALEESIHKNRGVYFQNILVLGTATLLGAAFAVKSSKKSED